MYILWGLRAAELLGSAALVLKSPPSHPRLRRPHKRAHYLPIHRIRQCRIDPSVFEKSPGVLCVINARRLDVDVLEADLGEQIPVLRLLEGSGDAAGPQGQAALRRFRELTPQHD